jgi:DnaK suppressor protein
MDINALKAEVAKLSSDSDYMDPGMQSAFKEHLQQTRSKLLEANESAVNEIKERGMPTGDEADKSSENEDVAKTHSEIDARKQQVTAINRALELIARGDYGYCIDCGDEIGVKRLLARPFAVRDIECATVHDKKNQLEFTRSPAV